MKKIKVTNGYLERIISNSSIIKKSFTTKTSYWLARIFDRFRQEAKVYFSERQKLIEKYAKRHDKDGEGFKKGDMVMRGQDIILENVGEFQKEMASLSEIEIEIGFDKIPFDLDKEPPCTVEEMELLLPLIEVKEIVS